MERSLQIPMIEQRLVSRMENAHSAIKRYLCNAIEVDRFEANCDTIPQHLRNVG